MRLFLLTLTTAFGLLFATASGAAPTGMTRPRLLTGDGALPEAAEAGSPTLLIVVACLITVATLGWWGWWAIRYRAAALNDTERAFRRLARVVGLGHADREYLRSLCREAGIEPLAALASPNLASLACSDAVGPPRRIARLRRLLCDTTPERAGITDG